MPEKDYYSFEEALKNLSMEEDELKKLVSAGEIRAFRDKQTMRFKAEDVERLKSSDDLDDLDVDLDLDLDMDLEEEGGGDADLILSDEEPGGSDDLILETDDLGDDFGGDAGLDMGDELGDELGEELGDELGELGGEVEELDLSAEPMSGATELRSKRRVGADARAEPEEATEGPAFTALLCVSAAALLIAGFTIFSAVAGHSNPTNGWIVRFFS